MAINKKLIYIETKDLFNKLIANLADTSIVFIKDTGELWTHGKLFAGNFSSVDNDKISLTLGGLTIELSKASHTHSYLPLTGGTLSGSLTFSSGNILFNTNSVLRWNNGTYLLQISITDDSSAGTSVFNFQQSSNSGGSWSTLASIYDNGYIHATGFYKNGSSNSYVLLGNGGHKLVSDFASASSLNNYVLKSNSGSASIVADSDSSTTSEYLSLKAGKNELKITSHGSGQDVNKLTYNGYKVWHSGNDGSGSELDADLLDGVQLSGIFTKLSYSLSVLTATIGTTSKTVNLVGAYPNVSNINMNTVAAYGNSMGMVSLTGNSSIVNPNGATGWHHFINMSYHTLSDNMWQSLIAIKAGTTEVWVRSRSGGTISDNTAWGADWVRLARITDNVSSATNADTLDGFHADSFAKIGSPNNLIHAGNEFTFASSAYNGLININWRTAGGTNGNITGYKFCDGKSGELATITKGLFSGNAASATLSNSSLVLDLNSRMDYGWNGVNYFNADLKAGNTAKVNDSPTSAWWHILRFNHANSSGYYTDLAIPFNSNSLYYKRIGGGVVLNNGWVQVLDVLNYTSTLDNRYSQLNHTHNYLPLSGGNLTGPINNSFSTNTYIQGNLGKTLINSTAGAGAYVMLFKGNSTNGYFTHGVYQGTYLLQYTDKSTVDAGTNSVTKSVTLLNESGNSSFPGNITAINFIKSGSSNSYVLLGGGNHKAVSDFATANHTHSIYASIDHSHKVIKNNLMLKGSNGISDSTAITLGLGDSDTGFKWISDGTVQICTNNNAIGLWSGNGMNWLVLPLVNGNKIWHAGNDGSGSGLDADTVDGYHSASFMRFLDGANYVAARFIDSNLATTAANKYIEWWQTDAGWFNFKVGKYYAVSGFVKEGSSDSYILLGGGGHKGTWEFASSNIMGYKDSRDINYNPYDGSLSPLGLSSTHLKNNNADGLSDGGIFHTSIYLHPWSDSSGGFAHNLAFTDNGNIWLRSGTNGWSNWEKLAFITDNVASATRLRDTRYIWGLQFNGMYNVTGGMTNVSSIELRNGPIVGVSSIHFTHAKACHFNELGNIVQKFSPSTDTSWNVLRGDGQSSLSVNSTNGAVTANYQFRLNNDKLILDPTKGLFTTELAVQNSIIWCGINTYTTNGYRYILGWHDGTNDGWHTGYGIGSYRPGSGQWGSIVFEVCKKYDAAADSRLTLMELRGESNTLWISGTLSQNSDIRLKSDILPLSNRGFVTPIKYTMGEQCSLGFSALEMLSKYPELVIEGGSKEKYLSVNYSGYTAVLQAQIIELNNKLEQLLLKFDALRKKINI